MSGFRRLARRALSGGGGGARVPTVTLYTKEGCTLCEPVKFLIGRVGRRHPLRYDEVDIAAPGRERDFELYKHDIPVVAVDGVEVARHRLDERDLVAAVVEASK